VPFPVVAHQGLAAPAMLVRRWRLDGVALLAGTLAPDLPFALDRSRLDVDAGSHSLPALVWLCIPVAVVVGVVFRNAVARPLAAHLPDAGPLRLKDVAHAAGDWHPLPTTALSAVLGGLTHLVADGFTHPEAWATDRVPWLLHRASAPGFVGPAYRPTYHYDLVGTAATTLGVAAVLVVVVVAARRRARDGGPRPVLPAPTVDSYRLLWGSTLAGALAGLAAAARVWGPETRAQATMLATVAVAAGLTAGCAWATRTLDADRPAASRTG
jgi:uncharacterized protein DUF4184